MRAMVNVVLLTILFLFARTEPAVAESILEIKAVNSGAKVTVDRVMEDGKALISVVDAKKQPVFGLKSKDFSVIQNGRTARLTSVQPLAESLDVPRHIVLVLDNSDSMRQRHAVDALLAGVDELLKIVRPIDRLHMVVFDNQQPSAIAGRDLFVKSFASSQADELRTFVAGIYRNAVTPTTVLYDAMFAGIEILRTMPAGEPRFLVVFSDGEDLNSLVKREEIGKAAQGAGRFDAYAIDYMPGAATDKFLAEFTAQNHGQIWKATSETNLVPIFQSVASRMQYYYVVSYIFPPTGSLKVNPSALVVDQVKSGSWLMGESIDTPELRVMPTVDSAYGFSGWQAVLTNSSGEIAALSGDGAPDRELRFPLKSDMVSKIADGGNLQVTLKMKDRKGQELVLKSPPVKVSVYRTAGTLSVIPQSITIEEIKTIDASPMLGHIYFAKGSSEIPSPYVKLAGPEATAGFDEQQFRDTLEKYYQVLNIVGKRLVDHPEASITLVGCNADSGPEKGKKKLSAARAETVRTYLQAIWNIAPERITVEVRNLPAMPSTSRYEEGQAENRRVEIRSEHPAILDLIRSTYINNRVDIPALTLKPEVASTRGIDTWKVSISDAAGVVSELAGQGVPSSQIALPLPTDKLASLATGGDLSVTMDVRDRKGQNLALVAPPVKVNFIQTSQRLSLKQDLTIQEKYALILFDFDKDTIDARNQVIVDGIVARLRELPQATVAIVGHTDNIGKETYNIKLSERRALAVYKMLVAAYGDKPGDRLRYKGVGPSNPLYDNQTPEARSFNRTVTITLEYLAPN